MALSTPQLLTTAAFDANKEKTFEFTVTGGDQVTANKLVIRDNGTLTEVYSKKIESFEFKHTVPAETLTNGHYYQAYVTTFNSTGSESARSNSIQFYCYSTPTFVFSNMPEGSVIQSSSYNFEVTYNQAEGEILNSYTYTLYNAENIAIDTSGVQYVGTTEAPPTTLNYLFTSLNDSTNYYIQVKGTTIEGTEIETELTPIYVKFIRIDFTTKVDLTNNCQGGYITAQTKLSNISGTSEPDPPLYVKDKTAVNLTEDGTYVDFGKGFVIKNDFTASLWGYAINPNKEIIYMHDANGNKISIRYMKEMPEEGIGGVYADLNADSNGVHYYVFSDTIPTPDVNDKVQIWFRRIDNLFTIKLVNLGNDGSTAVTRVMAPKATTVEFKTADWTKVADDKYTITVPASQHKRENDAFIFRAYELDNGKYITNTFGVMDMMFKYNSSNGDFTATTDVPFTGIFVFT